MTLRMARGIIYVKFILMHVRPSYFSSLAKKCQRFFFEFALLLLIIFVLIIWIVDLNCMGKWLQIIGRQKHTNTHVLKNELFYFLTFPEKKRFIWLLLLQGVSKVKLLQLPWASLISEYRYVGIYCKMHTYTHNEGKKWFLLITNSTF